MRAIQKLFSLLLVMVLLSACGFHLRGSVELSSELLPIYISEQGVDNNLLREVRALLSQSDKDSLSATRSGAKSILNILSARQKRRVVAVDDRGRARQYELTYLVRYSITGKNIAHTGKDDSYLINLKRDVIFDPDSVLAISHEAENLYNDMRKDSARLILLRLQALGSGKADTQAADVKKE